MESLKSKLMEERQEMVKALEEHHSALRIFVPCFQMVFILYLLYISLYLSAMCLLVYLLCLFIYNLFIYFPISLYILPWL